MKRSEYDISKDIRDTIDEMSKVTSKRRLITELNDKDVEDAIAITDDPRFGEKTLTNQMEAFKHAVHGNAKFAKTNDSDIKANPLVYFPKTGNLVFSGSIPSLSGLKFQFSLNDSTGSPYIFVEGLALSENNLVVLNKLYGFYKNWCDEWFAAGGLLEKLSKDKNRD